MEFVYRWLQRARLWAIVTGGIFLAVVFALNGTDGYPTGVPAWITVLILGVVALPWLSMLVVGCIYWVRASRARRRDIKAGRVFYTNRVSAWIDYHGIAVGLAVVAVILAIATWLASHDVKIGRG